MSHAENALKNFESQYITRTPKSKTMYESAKTLLPGGVSGGGKFLKPYPLYVTNGEGSKIYDLDGNEYIDTLMGAGASLLGHNYRPITKAVQEQLNKGLNFLIATELEFELAKRVNKMMPHLERVRFVNTGTEADIFALRAARAFTKKQKIGKFEGNYHGQFDYTLVSGSSGTSGSEQSPDSIFDCAGIPDAIKDTVVVLPYNNIEATTSLIQKHAKELAAVIIEPLAAFNGGSTLADKEFLRALREVTEDNNVLLVFDEVVTGFRLSMGGAAKYFGVAPDITGMGKIMGGGMPIGAYGGSAEIFEKVVTPTKTPADIQERIFQSGTFSGNPLSMVAGIAMLDEISRTNPYPHIDRLGERFRRGLMDIGGRLGIDIYQNGAGSIFFPHFAKSPVRNARELAKTDKATQKAFAMGLVANGVYLPPAHPGFTSSAHSDKDIDNMLAVSESVLKQIKAS